MFDSHVHTSMSTDSKMDIESAIKRADELGIGLIATDHMDSNYPGKAKFNFDPDEYFNKYEVYRSNRLLLGVELGMTMEFKDENEALIKKYPFDFVIGSIHFLGNKDIFYKDAYEGKSKREVYNEYLSSMYDNIKAHREIDSLGHIDYISRYSVYEDREIYYKEYKELIDEILKELISRQISLEINSRRLGDRTAIKNLMKIYKRYKEFGGLMVTLGSDAHNEESICSNFKAGFEIIREFDLELVFYKNRNPYRIDF